MRIAAWVLACALWFQAGCVQAPPEPKFDPTPSWFYLPDELAV